MALPSKDIVPYGRTFLRSIYRFRTQSIETFSTFYFEVKCLKHQLKHECYKISKIRAILDTFWTSKILIN
jgi:hypothetical protein